MKVVVVDSSEVRRCLEQLTGVSEVSLKQVVRHRSAVPRDYLPHDSGAETFPRNSLDPRLPNPSAMPPRLRIGHATSASGMAPSDREVSGQRRYTSRRCSAAKTVTTPPCSSMAYSTR